MTHTATYSPEDNKLRLYPGCRLDDDEFKRVKAYGFRWAPKQELFVAPAWTPEREDLLIELCGEVGDEDKSLAERQEERAERFGEYSESRLKDYNSAHSAVKSIADNIPFGQPILVGHHSERRARRDAEKIENGMRKAVKMWETSQYWTDRAHSAIAHAKYKERPDVRARRIKGIEADKRKQEKYRDNTEFCLKFWRGQLKRKAEVGGGFFEVNLKTALWFSGTHDRIYRCFPLDKYPRKPPASQYEGDMSLWSALGGSDGADHAIITVEQARDIAIATHESYLPRCLRWIAHYENRLSYERAMLAEDGGTATDQVKPEVGGACKCWASPRGGWSLIKKVNKVTVTVLDNFGNGGRNFYRNISFDKLSCLMSKADVDAARAEGRLLAETELGFLVANGDSPARSVRPIEKTPEDVEAMKATLKGGVKVVSAPQLFPTPPSLAEEVVSMADIMDGHRVLEPSAGTGNLIRAIRATRKAVHVVAVEVNVSLADALVKAFPAGVTDDCPQSLEIIAGDFLEPLAIGTFDRIIMNPPFENGVDIKHIERARELLAPGGVLVAICAAGSRQHAKLEPEADEWIDLPEGSFASEGTNVRVAMVVFRKPADVSEGDPFDLLKGLVV